jgi:ribosomal protein S18 acetylase RimI-like enzyme
VKTPFLALRDGTPTDEPLLFRLFVENKAREFAALPLTDEQLEPMLAMQYRLRCAGYASTHPGALQLIVEEGSTPVGHVLLSEGDSSIHIVDIAIAPAHQRRGLGTAVLLALQQRAASAEAELRLQVVPHSRAHQLYERLGFVVAAHDTMIDEMVWSPKPAHNP